MNEQPQLTEEEWDLILELLDRERQDLPVEIHHTRSSTVQEELRERLNLVRNLLHQLSRPAAV